MVNSNRKTPQQIAADTEARARTLRAKLEIQQMRAANKAMKAAMSTYQAADTGRKNRDWKSSNASADLAIIPDSTTLIGRARQLDRDVWVARSAVKSFCRNVVGRGINVIPHAKGPDGKPLSILNQVAQREFGRWSRNKKSVDVERRKSFAQMQRLAAKEQLRVGEHMWMWSYQPPFLPDGTIDRNRACGLKMQAFEPEQFDLRVLSYEGREVRGGVEVDENGAPLAYHVYTRNPNDVLYRHAFFSERVSADRMFHYFEQDRVLQSRGVSRLTPIMQSVRDLYRFEDATLWRTLMEACIGLIIQQPVAGGGHGASPSLLPRGNGDSGTTSSGLTEDDFVPGMVARTVPGETVQPFIPSTPGNQYGPFTERQVRNIGAGLGMSFGQIARQNDANYSAARQDMLEDRKEIEPEQELLIDDLIRPTYELWFSFAAHEGRFDGVEGFDMADFLESRWRFVEADYIPPPQTWIDPEKEANAFAVLLENRLITREEIVAMRGGRYFQTIERIADEQATTDALGLPLPENEKDRTELRELIKAMLANRLGTLDNVTGNAMDIPGLVRNAALPMRDGYTAPLLPVVSPPGNPVTGDPIENAAGQTIAGGVETVMPPVAAPASPLPVKLNVPKNGKRQSGLDSGDFGIPDAPPPTVPNYRRADDSAQSCTTCSFAVGIRCSRFNFVFDPANTCDDWQAVTLTENIGVPNVAKTFPPGPQPGERPLDRRFFPDADPTPRP